MAAVLMAVRAVPSGDDLACSADRLRFTQGDRACEQDLPAVHAVVGLAAELLGEMAVARHELSLITFSARISATRCRMLIPDSSSKMLTWPVTSRPQAPHRALTCANMSNPGVPPAAGWGRAIVKLGVR